MPDIHYLKGVNHYSNIKLMHDLKDNFDKILPIVNFTLDDDLNNDGNLQAYPNKPNMPDSHLITLALMQEALGIDSEHGYWRKLESDYAAAFPTLPHLTRYNRRRKRLSQWIHRLTKRWASQLLGSEDTFMVDSVPVPVAHIAREHNTSVCREHFHSAPDKGYCASKGSYYIGYKLHLVISLNGVFQSMDLTKASVHDVHYLNNIKWSGLSHCLLLADRGYLSASQQVDLFERAGIDLQTPMRRNQTEFKPWPKAFKKARRRVETTFSQLCDHMMLKRNYAKTFAGLRARIIGKIAAVTLLQYINSKNNKPINHIKHALAM